MCAQILFWATYENSLLNLVWLGVKKTPRVPGCNNVLTDRQEKSSYSNNNLIDNIINSRNWRKNVVYYSKLRSRKDIRGLYLKYLVLL